MLSVTEIKQFIDEDKVSKRKKQAKIGLKYYESEHDIKDYKIYYYDGDGELKEDKNKANIQIPHSFFTELIDQKTQYMFSGKGSFIKSDIPELQAVLDDYFDADFKQELSDVIRYGSAEGFSYLYAFKDDTDKLRFSFAEGIGIVEVESEYASDKQDHVIYYYPHKYKQKDKLVTKIQVWDKDYTWYYEMVDNEILTDSSYKMNPRPHILYNIKDKLFYDTFGFIPFFRYDNNRKQYSDLKPIKGLIDDYDLMSCGLSNNLQDLSEGYFVVKGFDGDNLDELINNVKMKKHIGVGDDGDLDVKTVTIPYEARKIKMELDEKNIYRFGMGFNSALLGDGNITNIVIKSRYALLDLKCNKCEDNVKKLLKKIVKVVLDEINDQNQTDYSLKDVYFNFEREVMTNAQDNAQIELLEAQTEQTKITTLLNVATKLDNETLMQSICDVLDVDYERIKDKLPKEDNDLDQASNNLINAPAIE